MFCDQIYDQIRKSTQDPTTSLTFNSIPRVNLYKRSGSDELMKVIRYNNITNTNPFSLNKRLRLIDIIKGLNVHLIITFSVNGFCTFTQGIEL